MAVKQIADAKETMGLLTELYGVLKHDFQRIVKWFYPNYPFISNQELIIRITAKLKRTRSASVVKFHRVLGDYHNIALKHFFNITFSSGERLNLESVYNMLKDLSLLPMNHSLDPAELDADQYLQVALTDVMERFGAPDIPDHFQIHAEQHKAFMEAAQLDTMKRIAQMHISSLSNMKIAMSDDERKDMEIRHQMRKLNVTIERARNLPHMDFSKGVDVFCAIFVEGNAGLFQTEVLRGRSEADWTWGNNASFDWELGPAMHVEDQDHKIVIMVYDKDQITSDELVGCVTVKLGELQTGLLDEWRQIILPPHVQKKGKLTECPQLKLKISLRTGKNRFLSESALQQPCSPGMEKCALSGDTTASSPVESAIDLVSAVPTMQWQPNVGNAANLPQAGIKTF